MTIRNDAGVPVILVRLATLRDVQTLGRRTPEDIDRQAIAAGAYVVVRKDSESTEFGEYLCHRADLRATDGQVEIDRAIGFVAQAALGGEVEFFVDLRSTTDGEPDASETCVRVTFDPTDDQVSLVPMERSGRKDAWTWARDVDVEVSRTMLESIVARVRQVASVYAGAQQARQAGDPGLETVALGSNPGTSPFRLGTPWMPSPGDACDLQLDVTGDRWWRARYLGPGPGDRPWGLRVWSIDPEMPRLGIVVQMRPTTSSDRPGTQ